MSWPPDREHYLCLAGILCERPMRLHWEQRHYWSPTSRRFHLSPSIENWQTPRVAKDFAC
jgi:hypothetical protein